MTWSEIGFAVPYLVSLGLALSLVFFGTQKNHVPVAGPLAVYALLQSIWIFGFLEEAFAPTLETKILWDNIQFVPFLLIPQMMLLTSRAILGKPILPLGPVHGAFLAGVGALLLLVWVDPLVHLIRPDPRLVEAFPRGELTYTFTPVLYGMALVTYVVAVVVLVRIWRHTWAQSGRNQKQGLMIFIGLVIPVLASLVPLGGIAIGPHRDIAPLTFGLGDLIIVVGILRYRILDLVPIAFETAFQAMADPIVVLDTEGTILAHNRSYAQLRGFPGTNLAGQSIHSPTNAPFKDGFDLVKIPMRAEGAEDQGVIWHYRDIRVLQEAQAHQIDRERLSALGRMANNLAHELNSPLASVLSASRFLDEKAQVWADRINDDALSRRLASLLQIPDGRSALDRLRDRRRWQEILESQANPRAAEWAERLNDAGLVPPPVFTPGDFTSSDWEASFAKACEAALLLTCLWIVREGAEKGVRVLAAIQGLERSEAERPLEPVLLQTVLSEALAHLRTQGNGTGKFEADVQSPAILGNKPLLTQLCLQLLKNARQACGPDGTVRIRARDERGWVVLEIEDDGPGIPDDQKQWIFAPFFTTRKAGEGSGLGLEIAKLVAKEHGAELSFTSRPGQTIFRAAFPVLESNP